MRLARLHVQKIGHERDDVGLRDRLPVADRQRAVLVRVASPRRPARSDGAGRRPTHGVEHDRIEALADQRHPVSGPCRPRSASPSGPSGGFWVCCGQVGAPPATTASASVAAIALRPVAPSAIRNATSSDPSIPAPDNQTASGPRRCRPMNVAAQLDGDKPHHWVRRRSSRWHRAGYRQKAIRRSSFTRKPARC